MKINTIKIKNFRGIPDMEISLERISFFTGPCGAGKTSVLKAFNFALTGDVKKDDIREQSDRASATIVFEDQSSIQRICKLSAATQVKVNGKNSTAKAADEFLQAKLGTSTDIFQAMCKTDFFEVLSQKEQTEFFLSILPTKISFEKLCEFIGENNKKLTEEEKTTLKTAFANISDPFGLDEIDMAYKYFYQKRKEKKAFVENLKPRAVFDMSILPEESKESLQKSLEDVIRKETLAKEYQKNLNEYNRQVKMKADSDVRLKKLKEEYQKYSSVEKPDPDYKEKQESEKKQFENAIHNCQTAISTIKGNLELLEKTLKSLNTNVCPISSRLICTSDRTPLKSEFEDQIQKSNEGIKKNTDFIKRCEKEVQIRTERLDAYQKQQISYNNKKNLHDQIQNYVPITVMEKPEEVKAPDMMVKQEIQSKISKYTSFENAKKAKCELEEEQKKLRILENLVLYLDSKTGVRGYILKKVVEPFTKMCNQKASKFHNMELKISFDNGIEFYGKTENSNGFVPIHRLSSGEHVFATYLLCTLIHQITKANDVIRIISEKYAEKLKNHSIQDIEDELIEAIRKECEGLDLTYEEQKRIEKTVIITALGQGPIEEYLRDPNITEIVVQRFDNVVIERNGKIESVKAVFFNEEHLVNTIERIVQSADRQINQSVPIADAKLSDGSRVNATIPPVTPDGATLTIRKFNMNWLKGKDYIKMHALNKEMLYFLERCVKGKQSIFISGGTGSGKTTLLNMLSEFIPNDELIITIEDVCELQLRQKNVRRMEVRVSNNKEMMKIDQQTLVKAALRQRPDRIILGESRDGSIVDLISAMSTGHDGSLSTGHANSPRNLCDVRIPIMYSMNKEADFSERSIAMQIAEAIKIIVQISRMPDRSRKITYISHVDGVTADGKVNIKDIFRYDELSGQFIKTKYYPKKIVESIRSKGLDFEEGIFKTKNKEESDE